MGMRRNRNGVRKERIIMLASSALVLTALTVTGVFVRNSRQKEDESNVVDFSVIENRVEESAESIMSDEDLDTLFAEVGTDDLDYDPYFQEANSGHVENAITGKNQKETDDTEKKTAEESENKQNTSTKQDAKKKEAQTESDGSKEGMFDESEETMLEEPEDTEAIATTVQPILDFGEEEELVWPIAGDILINYSMDKTVYFPTLQQYKYHPAIVISATVGESIAAAAEGRVVSVSYDTQLGNTVVMDLGNQYELTYGQLDNITVSEGSYVVTGDIIGSVASPTKYYSTEGANVYFKLTKDGQPVNPISKLKN
ncbi:MAG: peptidoglycan DD-metalloendopeptidase family protein [Bacillus sp. (in: Bacteria)]|nr:peptidoglycan DD-metalloendopeptidase family protein [Bacillus sp. (in: firmicutes)]MCM1426180.1 peptidoglycan DD-metalloendopeptidase family protein [Eubacterium sp.]